MTADDQRRLEAIMAAPDQRTIVELVAAYWRDLDRADRTPREHLYYHMGLLLAPAIAHTGARVSPPRVRLREKGN